MMMRNNPFLCTDLIPYSRAGLAGAGVRFCVSPALKPADFQSFRKSQPLKSSVPLSRSLSRSLSRWFVCIFNGLGGLSRCPAQYLTHVHTHMRTWKRSGTSGTAGQCVIILSFIQFNQRVNKNKDCPADCPAVVGGAGQMQKTHKIQGFYSWKG